MSNLCIFRDLQEQESKEPFATKIFSESLQLSQPFVSKIHRQYEEEAFKHIRNVPKILVLHGTCY